MAGETERKNEMSAPNKNEYKYSVISERGRDAKDGSADDPNDDSVVDNKKERGKIGFIFVFLITAFALGFGWLVFSDGFMGALFETVVILSCIFGALIFMAIAAICLVYAFGG